MYGLLESIWYQAKTMPVVISACRPMLVKPHSFYPDTTTPHYMDSISDYQSVYFLVK